MPHEINGFIRTLHDFGRELVSLHLMKPDIIKDPITRFPVTGNNAVERAGEEGSALRKETEIVDSYDYCIALNISYLKIIFNGRVKNFTNYNRGNEDWHC